MPRLVIVGDGDSERELSIPVPDTSWAVDPVAPVMARQGLAEAFTETSRTRQPLPARARTASGGGGRGRPGDVPAFVPTPGCKRVSSELARMGLSRGAQFGTRRASAATAAAMAAAGRYNGERSRRRRSWGHTRAADAIGRAHAPPGHCAGSAPHPAATVCAFEGRGIAVPGDCGSVGRRCIDGGGLGATGVTDACEGVR